MRFAIISDVHGNYPALAKVIEDAYENSADKFIFIGDYIFDLPFSNEVARLLMELDNAYIIKGNRENYLERFIRVNPSAVIYAAHYLKNIKSKDKILSRPSVFYKRMMKAPFTHEQFLKDYEADLNTGEYAAEINNINADVILYSPMPAYNLYVNRKTC